MRQENPMLNKIINMPLEELIENKEKLTQELYSLNRANLNSLCKNRPDYIIARELAIKLSNMLDGKEARVYLPAMDILYTTLILTLIRNRIAIKE